MSNWIKMYMTSLVIFLAIDFVWLAFIAKKMYSQYLGYIMTKNILWWAAILFYMIFVAGLLFFVIEPSVKKQSIEYAVYAGAFFGVVAYATYDLTNLSTIKDWPIIITVLDLIWGAFISACTSGVSYMVIRKFFIT